MKKILMIVFNALLFNYRIKDDIRITRSQYSLSVIILYSLWAFIFFGFYDFLMDTKSPLIILIMVISYTTLMNIVVRRIVDINFFSSFSLLVIYFITIPFMGFLIPFCLLFIIPGEAKDNKYGKNPYPIKKIYEKP